jgi:CheY-like chemotaxis protein
MNQDRKELRVLFIEDNPGDARLVEIMLRGQNGDGMGSVAYTIVHTDRLQDALRHVAEMQFDVVLLDLFLPDSDGMNTLRRLLGEVQRTPVIVMSGMKDGSMALQAVQEGAQDYTDQSMPQMTGERLARELMSLRPDIPVILCSGFSEGIDAEKAKAMGIRCFLLKPVLLRDLADAVRRALDAGGPVAGGRVSTR